jgi:hypothetical protein
MKNILATLLLGITVLCLSCNFSDKKTIASNVVDTTPKQHKVKGSWTFFDSVAAKMDLTLTQVRQHTILDTFYTNSLADTTKIRKFMGDTIYFAHAKFPLIILKYDDGHGVDTKTFLLVYDSITSKNTANMLVGDDGDVDYSTDDIQKNFKIISKKLFYTEEVWTQREGRAHQKTNKQTTERQYYTITDNGKIEKTRKNIRTQLVDKTEDDL